MAVVGERALGGMVLSQRHHRGATGYRDHAIGALAARFRRAAPTTRKRESSVPLGNRIGAVTYSATAYRLLVSAPGDVPGQDIEAVIAAVNRWNAIYGQQFGVVVVPTHWGQHSAAEHGGRPQASLNEQLVENADIVIALFWQRLGSPTGVAESGTVEEINEAHGAGAYVGILPCQRPFPASVDADQLQRLRAFLEESRASSLMLNYTDGADLSRHVDALLMNAISRDGARAALAVDVTTPQRHPAEVWPRIESDERVKTDSRGRVRTSRNWRLVLANTGSEPARKVQFRLESEGQDDRLPTQLDDDRPLEALAPGTEASYGLYPDSGSARQMRCVVTWEDDLGVHENSATVRLF